MRCELCGGDADELARTRAQVWLGCRDCHRSWRDDVRAAGAARAGDTGTRPAPDVSARRGSFLRRLLLTVGPVALAFALRFLFRPLIGTASPFLLFTPAVMVAAFYAGPWAGAIATALSALLGSHFFLQALGEPGIETWDRVALFLLVGALLTLLSIVVQNARQRLGDSLWREQQARAQAEAASQAKDEFLAMVSHELKTPASVVLGWASMIRSRQLTGDALDRALDVIERNARVQNKLVEDVLDTSRIVSGRMRFDRQLIDLSAVVAAAVEQMRPSIEARQLRLQQELAAEEWPIVGDAVRLQQVFTNLLANAVKFTPAGGRLSVAMSRRDGQAIVTVSDTGIGIAPSFLPRMFDRFEQDPGTLSLSRQGLGLGLSICRHFVEQHGGTITAASEGPGMGATFTVRLALDVSPRAPAAAHRLIVPSGALRSVSALVLGEDDDTRALLTGMLERYGASVTSSRSADEARAALARSGCDVVLCDLRMPAHDGLAFIRALRHDGDAQVASIPAVAITASSRLEDRQYALAAGFQLHLHKPVDADELAAALLQVVQPSRPSIVH